ncbi:conserved hypothetical protein [Paraburkholderia piptadeniae]|uniref:DUF2889 domain-containing protein n=2 Tax=Paraburkholderia TaxID=1822464 RepID=A0A7X1NB54_9BURK|nr:MULTISPECIES: DUF2889 domain-containing protein [Paraburkholderia]MPW18737.1 DUF2889 domain-containing protein [Paraburkholderia franconis]SIT48288.1 conserved hypothetical protein [Paraburkholderia piptadeniae]
MVEHISQPAISANEEHRGDSAGPTVKLTRELLHRRSFDCAGYQRDDGMLDIEITLIDSKPDDFLLTRGTRLGGQPMHHMAMWATVDADFRIVDVVVNSLATPYPGICDTIGASYRQIVGLNLLHGFRSAVSKLFGGIAGCSHLTEMLYLIPTLVIQSRAEERWQRRDNGQRPFEIDGCHALKASGELVKEVYPDWWKSQKTCSE